MSPQSLARRNHPRPRRWPSNFGHLLPLDLAAAAQDLRAVLGLLAALGRGAADHHQQVQHGAAAGLDRHDHPGARDPSDRYEHRTRRYAVSFLTLVQYLPLLTRARYVVATTTVWSGASYIYSKDAVKILTPQEAEEKAEDKKGPK